MNRHIAWLLHEIERQVEGHLTPEAKKSLLDEVSSHLDATVQANVARGMPLDEAEREAVRRFGSPNKYVEQLLDVHEPPGAKSWWRSTKWDTPTQVCFAAACIWSEVSAPFAYVYGSTSWLIGGSALFLAGFAFFAYRSRRVQLVPLTLSAVGAFCVSALFLAAMWLNTWHFGAKSVILTPVWGATARMQSEAKRVASVDAALAEFQRGQTLHFDRMSADEIARLSPKDHALMFSALGVVTPHSWPNPHPWGLFSGLVVNHTGPRPTEDAKREWQFGAVRAIGSLNQSRLEAVTEIAAIQKAQQASFLGNLAIDFSSRFGVIGHWLLLGILLNFLAASLGRLVDALRLRRLRGRFA